jgi:hypothetical protein
MLCDAAPQFDFSAPIALVGALNMPEEMWKCNGGVNYVEEVINVSSLIPAIFHWPPAGVIDLTTQSNFLNCTFSSSAHRTVSYLLLLLSR